MAQRGLLSLIRDRFDDSQDDELLNQQVKRTSSAARRGSGMGRLQDVLLGAAQGYASGSQASTPELGAAQGFLGGVGVGRASGDRRREQANLIDVELGPGVVRKLTPEQFITLSKATKGRKQFMGIQGTDALFYDSNSDQIVRQPVGEGEIMKPGTKKDITTQPGGGLTFAQKEVDKNFAKDYADFVTAGGYSDVEKNLNQLNLVRKALVGGQQASGPALGLVPKWGRDIVNPRGAALQDSVEEVVQRNLRLVLGAQFTQKEGDRLIERAYNPRQDERENAARLERLIKQIDDAARAKIRAAEYYEQKGTLQGFKGTMYTSANDFLREDSSGAPSGASLEQPSSGGKPKTVTQNGITYTLNEQTGEYE